MKVKYIGPNTKTDSITGLGLQWEPGQVREVTSTAAAHLLTYTDTWVQADGETHKHDDEEPVGLQEPDRRTDEPLAVVDFHSMDKDAIIKYAATHWNQRLDKKLDESVLRERAIKEHTKRQMEDKDS